MKKGFTLIELLASIVIMAVIALIATPIISNIVKNAKKQTFKQTVLSVIEESENYLGRKQLKHEALTFPMEFNCDGLSCISGEEKLELSGAIPKSGKVIIENIDSIRVVALTDGSNCITGTKEDLAITSCVGEIDITKPTLTVAFADNQLTLTYNDNVGVIAYCLTTESNSSHCTWVNTTGTSLVIDEIEDGVYNCYVKDAAGNISLPQSVEVENIVYYGLFSDADQLLISWDDLVNTYQLRISNDSTYKAYETDTHTGTYIFKTYNLSGVLKIPPTVTYIGAYVFYGCSGLKQVYIPESVTQIKANAFRKAGLQKAYFAASGWYRADNSASIDLSDPTTAAYKISSYKDDAISNITLKRD